MKPIRFKVTVDAPERHIARVEMTVRGVEEVASVDLHLPVWTPGSYLVREYSQFVRVIRAVDGKGNRKDVHKVDKATWRVDTGAALEITVLYEVYAHTLNVRYSHIEPDHAFLHGPSIFLYPAERLGDEIDVLLELPDDWEVYCGLEQPEASSRYLEARDFDELFDCPILAGQNLRSIEFAAANVPHRFVFWGRGEVPEDRLGPDTRRIIEASAQIFGSTVPYDDYAFLTLLTHNDYGGLEHRNSTALMFPRKALSREVTKPAKDDDVPALDDDYIDFLGLVSHEHFHVWNVKRIRPKNLGPFDYQRENYTRDLWTVEGITSYYTYVSLLRAGLIDGDKFLEIMSKQLSRMLQVPGRKQSSLRDASFDAWIKLYRPHPHNRNSTISYYVKGALAAMVLDVVLRVDSAGEKSLDDVMRHLWMHFSGEVGFPEGGIQTIVEEAVGIDVAEFFDIFIRGTDDPDWNDWLENIGLEVVADPEADEPKAFFGFDTQRDTEVSFVWSDSPAEAGGLQPGDEIVAIYGLRAADGLDALVRRARPGVTAGFHVFRRGELLELEITPTKNEPLPSTIRRRQDATPVARRLLAGWLCEAADAASSEEE